MSDLGRKFMAASLGADGAQALKKAAEREPRLDAILIPRAIVGWLTFATEHEFEGAIPGVENSYVQFQKSEGGFSGSISLQDGIYGFESASVYHLAASIAMALGVAPSTLDVDVRDTVLARLGKSVDTLAKAQVLLQELKSPKALKPQKLSSHGTYHVEHNGGNERPYSVVHSGTGKEVQAGIASLRDAGEIANWHHKNKPQMEKAEGPGPSHAATAQQGPIAPVQAIKQPSMGSAKAGSAKPKLPKAPKQPSLSVGKSEAAQPCEICGGHQFGGNRFVGCICFKDLSKHVKTTAYSDGYVLDFDSGIDTDSVRALMKTFRSK